MSAEAGLHDEETRCGQFWRRTLTWTDSDGNTVDLTGYSAMMQVRRNVDTVVLIELSSAAGGGITLGGTAGAIERVPDCQVGDLRRGDLRRPTKNRRTRRTGDC